MTVGGGVVVVGFWRSIFLEICVDGSRIPISGSLRDTRGGRFRSAGLRRWRWTLPYKELWPRGRSQGTTPWQTPGQTQTRDASLATFGLPLGRRRSRTTRTNFSWYAQILPTDDDSEARNQEDVVRW